MKLHIDFETYSACELKSAGLDNYAKDPSTGVWCMAYGFDEEDVLLWRPGSCDIERVRDHIAKGEVVYAHNAPFELAIWNNVMVPKFNWPRLEPKQVRCTMAMAYAMGLPGALENLAPALGIEQRKDAAGKRVMMQLAKPKEDGTFWNPETDPEKFQKLYDYCIQDVVVERSAENRMVKMIPSELDVWQLDYLINQRGVAIDIPSVNAAIALVETEKNRLDNDIRKLTGNSVAGSSDLTQLKKWIQFRGIETKGLAKGDIITLLDGELPSDVRQVLGLRREAAKTSTAKLIAMRDAASMDNRVRGILQYHGAATGRWAGRRIQVQNLPRGFLKPKQVEDAIAHFKDADYLDIMYGNPLDVISSCIRGMIVAAPGNELICSDFSNIEGRVLAWLAGEAWKLDAFKDYDTIVGTDAKGEPIRVGADLYVLSYAKSFGVTLEEALPHRQIGKVQELALGYQGGVGAFQTMAKTYRVTVSDERADELKLFWRNAHPNVVQYWYNLEDAAIAAVHNPRTKFTVGAKGSEVIFLKNGSFLWCRLPSGRALCYPYPKVIQIMTPWGAEKEALSYMTVVDDSTRRKGNTIADPNSSGSWQRISTYGGSLAENVTQAVARDLLSEALLRLEDKNIPTIMHVHDEVVVEGPKGTVTLDEVENVMAVVPAWARGLPLASAGWCGERYRKD